MSKHELNLLSRIDPSSLSCPFTTEPNAHAAAVQAQTASWLEQTGIQLQPALQAQLLEVGWLCAFTYPNASRDRLQLTADWSTLFFLLDDLVEQVDSREAIVARNTVVVDVLAGHYRPLGEPLLNAIYDVGRRAERIGGAGWMAHFVEQVAYWLDAHLWEFDNRGANRVPPLEEYLVNRPYSIGMYFEFLLSELTDHYQLTDVQRQDPVLIRLAQIASNQIAWTNDILTLEKELAQGDVHNLVLSLVKSRGLNLGQALSNAVDMHNREVAAFLDLELALERSCPTAVARYITALRNWMGGHLRWGIASKRYGGSRLSTTPLRATA